MLHSKTLFLIVLVLTLKTSAIVSSNSISTTFFTNLSKKWYLSTEKTLAASDVASFLSYNSYWGPKSKCFAKL